jgi:Prealbumin-like fold domain
MGYWLSLLSMRKPYRLLTVVVLFASFCRAGLAQPPSTPKAESETGIEGVIVVGPIHGGPSKRGDLDSAPLANTEFLVVKENSTVASFKTDDQGRFRISLPAGRYTISRKGEKAAIGGYGPFEVEVAAGQMKRVQWSCDSGMR